MEIDEPRSKAIIDCLILHPLPPPIPKLPFMSPSIPLDSMRFLPDQALEGHRIRSVASDGMLGIFLGGSAV